MCSYLWENKRNFQLRKTLSSNWKRLFLLLLNLESSVIRLEIQWTVRDAKQGRGAHGQRWKDISKLIKLRLTDSIHLSQTFKKS